MDQQNIQQSSEKQSLDNKGTNSNGEKNSGWKWVAAIVVAVVAIFIVIYGMVKDKAEEQQEPVQGIETYFEWKVKDESLDPSTVDVFYQRFLTAKSILEEDNNNFNGWLMLGEAKMQVGDYEGARDAWEYLSEIRPKNSLSFGNLAALYTYNLYNPEKAEYNYLKAIENSKGEPFNINYYRNYAEFALYFLQDREKAKNILKEGIDANPDRYYDLAVFLADIYKEEGDSENAIQYLEKALEIKPDSALIKEELQKLRNAK